MASQADEKQAPLFLFRGAGSFVHQQHEAAKAKALALPPRPVFRAGTIESPPADDGNSMLWPLIGTVLEIVAAAVSDNP